MLYDPAKYGDTKKHVERKTQDDGIYSDCPCWIRITDMGRPNRFGREFTIYAKDTKTGESLVFSGIKDLSKHMRLDPSYLTGKLFNNGFFSSGSLMIGLSPL